MLYIEKQQHFIMLNLNQDVAHPQYQELTQEFLKRKILIK